MTSWHPAYHCLDADSDGFPKILREIPATSVMDFFRGLDLLPPPQRTAMIATATEHANAYLRNILNPDDHPRPRNHEDMWNIQNLGRANSRFEHHPLKILKQWVGAMKSDKPGAKRMLGPEGVVPEVIAFVDQFEMIDAAEMRKRLKAFLGDEFGLNASKWIDGTWHYRSPERAVGIEIDFSGSYGQQLCYTILHPKTKQMNLELMWGLGVGKWNYLHQGNFEESLQILGKIYRFFEQALQED
jgi:hypothetical protein